MKFDFNQIVTELLQENKMSKLDEKSKGIYIDGVLDFYNKMKNTQDKKKEKLCQNTQQDGQQV